MKMRACQEESFGENYHAFGLPYYYIFIIIFFIIDVVQAHTEVLYKRILVCVLRILLV